MGVIIVPLTVVVELVFSLILLAPTDSDLKESFGTKKNERPKPKDGNRARRQVRIINAADLKDTLDTLDRVALLSPFRQVPTDVGTRRRAAELSIRSHAATQRNFKGAASGSSSSSGDGEHFTLHRLIKELLQHHEKLKGRTVAQVAFEKNWGIVSDVFDGSVDVSPQARIRLEAALTETAEAAKEQLETMKNSPKEAAGAHLLRLFCKDLLGSHSVESKILVNQYKCKEIRDTRIVNWTIKQVTVMIVVLVNLACIYFCLLYGHAKGPKWQQEWISNVGFAIGLQVFFYDVCTVLAVNFFIPELIRRDGAAMREEVEKMIRKLCFSDRPPKKGSFSAADYLFVSTVGQLFIV